MSQMILTFDEIKQRLQPIFAGHQIRQAILFGSHGVCGGAAGGSGR